MATRRRSAPKPAPQRAGGQGNHGPADIERGLLAYVEAGESLRRASRATDIPETTIGGWVRDERHAETLAAFRDVHARARATAQEHAECKCLDTLTAMLDEAERLRAKGGLQGRDLANLIASMSQAWERLRSNGGGQSTGKAAFVVRIDSGIKRRPEAASG